MGIDMPKVVQKCLDGSVELLGEYEYGVVEKELATLCDWTFYASTELAGKWRKMVGANLVHHQSNGMSGSRLIFVERSPSGDHISWYSFTVIHGDLAQK